MDAAAIRNCIAATLDADTDVRRRAELQLKQVRQCVGVGAWVCARAGETGTSRPRARSRGRPRGTTHLPASLMLQR